MPQLDELCIFYLKRSDDEHTFRDTLDNNGLTGLRFEPIWANDGSIAPRNLIGL